MKNETMNCIASSVIRIILIPIYNIYIYIISNFLKNNYYSRLFPSRSRTILFESCEIERERKLSIFTSRESFERIRIDGVYPDTPWRNRVSISVPAIDSSLSPFSPGVATSRPCTWTSTTMCVKRFPLLSVDADVEPSLAPL